MHAATSTLKPLNALYHSALRFITGDGYRTHHCVLYDKVGWPSLAVRREQHCMIFIYKALIHILPTYLTSLISLRICNSHTRSQEALILNIPIVRTEMGKTAFKFYAPQRWNYLQSKLKLQSLVSLDSFKNLMVNVLKYECNCEF